jgi:integrase
VGDVLPRKRQPGQMAALIEFTALGDLLKRAKPARLSPSVHLAHRLIAFTAMRISNVVNATWRAFDLDASPAIWTIRRASMKKKDARLPDHRIPLPAQVAAELRSGVTFPAIPNTCSRRRTTHAGQSAAQPSRRRTEKAWV